MLLVIGTERLEANRLGAGTVREQDVKDFLDRVQRANAWATPPSPKRATPYGGLRRGVLCLQLQAPASGRSADSNPLMSAGVLAELGGGVDRVATHDRSRPVGEGRSAYRLAGIEHRARSIRLDLH